jgi:hypothetical protein
VVFSTLYPFLKVWRLLIKINLGYVFMRTLKFLPQVRLEVWITITNLLNLVLITRKSIILCFLFLRTNRKEICDCYRNRLQPFAGNIVSFHGFEEAELGRESRVIRNTASWYLLPGQDRVNHSHFGWKK